MDQVALYLNRATLLIKAAGGKISYITGNDATSVSCSGQRAEETQIASFGDAVWIANNDDADSSTQRELLDKLGISSSKELIDHVDNYQGRVLSSHKGAFTPGAMTPEETLLYKMATRSDAESGTSLAVPGTLAPAAKAAANPSFKISGAGPAPTAGIVFVVGSYVGGEGTSEHAEQKLLAALGKTPRAMSAAVTISGCKMACSTCKEVLDKAAARFKSSGGQLRFNNSIVGIWRDEAKLSKKHAKGIRSLDVAHYFGA
ncbi:hypothetical protein D621_21480 [beta proteobacterium AAP51]|nr:hypothetical protein D621_21480 [beta proteobacterium AAP51]